MTTATRRGAPPARADRAPTDCSLVVDADADTDVDTDVDADVDADGYADVDADCPVMACSVMALLLATGVAAVP
ncbi:hypothetical protein ACH4KT_26615 [Streptomyces anulatus]